jgi:uncharacterized protein involved in exopolysaccharide biosynthesis/Mrp family chromosome partitioning ATPase
MLTVTPIPLPGQALAEEPLSRHDRDVLNTESIIRFMRRYWRLCLLWVFAAVCAGITFTMLSPTYYTAYVTILLEDRTSRPLADSAGGAVVPDPAYADSQVQLLQSDEVVGRVVDQNRLVQDEEFGRAGGSLYALIMSYVRPGSTIGPTPRHATTTRVKRSLSVRRVGITNVVEVGFTSRNAVRAAAIANAIAESYIEGQREQKRVARADAAAYLRERLRELRDKAFAAEQEDPASSFTSSETGEQARARLREQQNRAEIHRALYNSFLQRTYTEYDQQFSSAGARVITPATPPIERSWPRALLVLGLAAIGGAGGGIGHALLRQATDHRLRTPEDVQRSTGLGRIAAAPKVKAWTRTADSRRGLQPVYEGCSATLSGAISKVAVGLQGRQSYRSGVIIAVVAPTKGSGASSVAAHLARLIAQSGQKTLLVDANWRKPPTVQPMLNAEPGRKLATALASIELAAGKLDILVQRRVTPISELNAALSIVNNLHCHGGYDCVVVDFHSAEETADLEASVAIISEVIVVVEAGRTTSEKLNDVVRLVSREKIAAVMLNKI